MKYLKYILAILILLIPALYSFGLFVMNSGASITLKVLPSVEVTYGAATFFLLTFLSGLIVGALIVSLSLLGQKFKTGRAKRELKKVEKEVEGLRATSTEAAQP